MGRSQPLQSVAPTAAQEYLAHYWRDGYAIVRGLFSPDEIAKSLKPPTSSMPKA